MPGQSAQVFTSTNNYYQIIGGSSSRRIGNKVVGDRQYGICFAVTTLWCKNVLNGHRPLLTKPDAHRAEALHAMYRINPQGPDESKQDIFAMAEVKGAKTITDRSAYFCLARMAAEAGVYLVSNGGHVIGFRTGAGNMWFYDCDENGAGGLWIYDNVDDWQDKAAEFYPSDQNWSTWKMTL